MISGQISNYLYINTTVYCQWAGLVGHVCFTHPIQYHRERCTNTPPLKIDPFHIADQSCPPSPSLPPTFPQPSPSLALSRWHVLYWSWNGTNLIFPTLRRTPQALLASCSHFNLAVISLNIFPAESRPDFPKDIYFVWWSARTRRLIRKQREASDTSYGLLVCVSWY